MASKSGWKNFLYKQKRCGWSFSLILWRLLSRMVGKKVIDGFGGRVRIAVSGGAPLPYEVGRFFLSMGLPLLQGYGMTETSPVISVNRLEDNFPESVGSLLPGVKIEIDDNGEILVRSAGVMLGYWNNDAATKEMIDGQGRLHTGDVGELKTDHLYITGRVKHIIVMSNGEKVPTSDIEGKVSGVPFLENTVVIGENRPFLSLVASVNGEKLQEEFGAKQGVSEPLNDDRLKKHVIGIVNGCLTGMPSYAMIRNVFLTAEPWTVGNGLLTPTMKVRRKEVVDRYKNEIELLYKAKTGR